LLASAGGGGVAAGGATHPTVAFQRREGFADGRASQPGCRRELGGRGVWLRRECAEDAVGRRGGGHDLTFVASRGCGSCRGYLDTADHLKANVGENAGVLFGGR
jgi:hypothetical protein